MRRESLKVDMGFTEDIEGRWDRIFEILEQMEQEAIRETKSLSEIIKIS